MSEATNLAENWMHVMSQYDGKVIHSLLRGSWEHLCMMADVQTSVIHHFGKFEIYIYRMIYLLSHTSIMSRTIFFCSTVC